MKFRLKGLDSASPQRPVELRERDWRNRHHMVSAVVFAIGLAAAGILFGFRAMTPVLLGWQLWEIVLTTTLFLVPLRMTTVELSRLPK
jgi:hypothetical protein